MTEEYTKIQLTRQEELTRRIQERLAGVGEKQPAVVQDRRGLRQISGLRCSRQKSGHHANQ
jgi:hypothetical protein